MNPKEKPAHTQFTNRPFRAQVDSTPAGSIRIHFKSATERLCSERKLSALIYEVAAALERRTEAIKARWAICPYAYDAYLDVELGARDNREIAAAMVVEVLQEAGLL
jgi:hypothetical protein